MRANRGAKSHAMNDLGAVLVTGAGGFIGQHLVAKLLQDGQKVIALDIKLGNLASVENNALLHRAEVDLRQHDALDETVSQADTIINLAAAHLEVGVEESYFYDVNVRALENLLTLAAKHQIRRFVHCSSVGVYGPLPATLANEDTACHPDIAYEKTKLQGEQAVIDATKRTNLSAVILRPSWVYGSGCPRTEKLLRSVAKRRFFFVGDGANLRHPIYISDLLRALELSATMEIPTGEIIIAAGPRPVTTRELVEQILAMTDSDFRPPTLPIAPVSLACHIAERLYSLVDRQPPFSSRSLKFFTDNSAFEGSKAKCLLGFEPIVDLNEGLEKVLQDARAHGSAGRERV